MRFATLEDPAPDSCEVVEGVKLFTYETKTKDGGIRPHAKAWRGRAERPYARFYFPSEDRRTEWLESIWGTEEELATDAAAHTTQAMEGAALATQVAFESAFAAISESIDENMRKLSALTKPEKPGLGDDAWERGWTSQFITDRPGERREEEGKRAADEIARYEQELAEFTAAEQTLLDERHALQVQAMNAAIAEGEKSFAEEQKALDAANIDELAEQQSAALEMVGNVRISQEKKVLDTLAQESAEIVKEFAAEMAQSGNAYLQAMLAAGTALTGSLDTANISMDLLNEGASEYEQTMQRVRELQGAGAEGGGGGDGTGGGRGGGFGDDPGGIFDESFYTPIDPGGGDIETQSQGRGQRVPPPGGGMTQYFNITVSGAQDPRLVAQEIRREQIIASRRGVTLMNKRGIV